ncbi:MAG: aminoglycoside phosphotransferase family protein [Clostridia bacterium]|nr:aminoglycoside phosphotransferase family protein [Clostridia bacterium]
MNYSLNEICSKFDIDPTIGSYGNGHINDTYLCQSNPNYILQKINNVVFKSPEEVMENISNVTKHLKEKIREAGGDPERETLTVVPTIDGKNYYKDDNGNYFRMYKYIENSVSYDLVEDPIQLYYTGKAFGKFQNMLDDFPAEKLHETIKDFHNTPERVNQLLAAMEKNAAGRLDSVKEEVEFALEFRKYASIITDQMAEGTVPLRVTHNDTKLNNILFDDKTNEGVCVIDLDTVMPGSMLYDFGDALRSGATSGAEDETDLRKIWFDIAKFEQFTKGFVGEMRDTITEKEAELLAMSALIMSYECGIRFLADYLNGDVYFKTHREGQNLDRARNQFKLAKNIESKLDELNAIVNKYLV